MNITQSALTGIGLIIGISLVAIVLEWTTLDLAIQIATIMIAFLVTGTCLLHIYRQHQQNYKKEQHLRKQVLTKIYGLWPGLSNHRAVQEHLEQILEVYGLEQRLKKLSRYHENSKTLKLFVKRLKRLEATQETLKNLGLSWGHKH